MFTADFENQSAHLLAAQYDPDGARTIGISMLHGRCFYLLIRAYVGVLTKPDRIPVGEEAVWINKIQSSDEGGEIEYFSVKNPDSQDIKSGITYEQAREREAEFFSTREPWSTIERLFRRRLGTENLTRRLGQVLSNLISKRQVFAV
jgi:Dynamin central region